MNRKTFLARLTAGGTALTLGPSATWAARTPVSGIGATSLHSADLQDWSRVRDLFPLDRDRLYFNTGGLGPPSRPVLETLQEQALKQAMEGETSHNRFEEARATLARFMGADPEELAFTRNASESNSIIASGLRLRTGDEVIFESHAHPGGSHPWLVRQKEQGIRVRIFEPDTRDPARNLERILGLVNERTRVVQVSHLTAPTGILFDVKAIARACRERGIWFHVDGAQSAGMLPVDLQAIGCDSFAASGHKWLNGPQESGFLYIARHRIDEVACRHAGAYSDYGYELPDTFKYNPTVQRHEYGTRDAASVLGLQTALHLQEAIGKERIARHGQRLARLCMEQLREIPNLTVLTPDHPELYHAMVAFRIKDMDNRTVFAELNNRHGLRCRPVDERGLNAVRISWHVYHQESDIERLLAGVRAVARG